MSVDDMVDTVFQTLDADGETQDTLAIFISDNGFAWGEHGLRAKGSPYTDSVKVPLYLRWPGHVAAGATDSRFAANIDLAPTVLDATGLAGDIPMDGGSLLDPQQQRTRLLTEFYRDQEPWASLRTSGAHYIEYYLPPDFQRVSHREYYDLTSDPYELTNLLGDGDTGNDPNVAPLAAQLAEDRVCSGAECP
jgi:arylsulfatase A-like enzyme